ncbi:hypothetical protein FI667_g16905, partial [Globisporangium splendens]
MKTSAANTEWRKQWRANSSRQQVTIPTDATFAEAERAFQDEDRTAAERKAAALRGVPTPVNSDQCYPMWIPARDLTSTFSDTEIMTSLGGDQKSTLWANSIVHLRDFKVIRVKGVSFTCTDREIARTGVSQLTVCDVVQNSTHQDENANRERACAENNPIRLLETAHAELYMDGGKFHPSNPKPDPIETYPKVERNMPVPSLCLGSQEALAHDNCPKLHNFRFFRLSQILIPPGIDPATSTIPNQAQTLAPPYTQEHKAQLSNLVIPVLHFDLISLYWSNRIVALTEKLHICIFHPWYRWWRIGKHPLRV